MADLFNDPDDYSSEEGVEAPPKPLWAKILGNAVKIIFWTLIILMNALLLWRLFSSGNPSELKAVTPNPELKAAYSAFLAEKEAGQTGGKDLFAAHQQENSRTNITDEDADAETGFPGNYGYFALTDQVLFPTAGQAQVIFRYNLSTLDHLAEDYSLSGRPDPGEDWYDVTLRVETNDVVTITYKVRPRGYVPADFLPRGAAFEWSRQTDGEGRVREIEYRRFFVADGAKATPVLTIPYYDPRKKAYRTAKAGGMPLKYVSSDRP